MIVPDSKKPRVLLKIGPGTVIQHFQCTLLVKPVTGQPCGKDKDADALSLDGRCGHL